MDSVPQWLQLEQWTVGMSGISPVSVRTLLVSDVHLGCKHARTEEFLEFIQRYRPETLYLVGDFFDAWKINSGWHWPEHCDRIVRHLVSMVDQGTVVHYTPGNHDSFLRQSAFRSVLPAGFPDVKISDEFVFETLHGWKFLVTHGDLFDYFETKAQWVSKGSSAFYDACLSLNRWVQRRFLGEHRNPYGACAVIKGRVKRGVKFISRYEDKIMRHAKSRECDGVICGHIHTPVIKQSDSVLYCNTGDWVENCTGLVEHHSGALQLVSRYEESTSIPLRRRSQRADALLEVAVEDTLTEQRPSEQRPSEQRPSEQRPSELGAGESTGPRPQEQNEQCDEQCDEQPVREHEAVA